MPVPTRNHPLHALALILLAAATLAWGQEPAASPGELLDRGDHRGAIALLRAYAEEYEHQLASPAPDPAVGKKLAAVLIWQGSLELDLTEAQGAIESFTRARALLESAAPDPRLLGTCLDGLGRALQHAGDYQSAVPVLEQALAHRLSLPAGQRAKWAPATREHLGLLMLAMGRYQDAGTQLKESLAETPSHDQGALAQRHSSLGRYHHALRSYARSRNHLEKALALAEQAWGRDDPNTFAVLDQLGLTLLRQGETARARAALEEATALAREQADTTIGGLRFATILNNYGNLLIEEDDLAGAREAFLSALATLEDTLGHQHPALAPLWNNLGFTCLEQGDHELALGYFEKARDSHLSHVGPLHQRSVEALTNLALASFLTGRPEAADDIAQAASAHQAMIPGLLSFGTETQRLNYLQRVDPFSAPCSAGHDPGLIANTLIQTKGRLLDALILEKAPRKPDHSPALDWQAVQRTLIPGSALVDFVRYHDYAPRSTRGLAYGAVLILPEGEPRWIPLGTEEVLLNWLGAVQDRLAWRSSQPDTANSTPPPPLKLRPALRRLHEEFWAPVAAALPDTTHTLALAPDASLNFLSFATLLDREDQFLCQSHPVVTYLTSARDLLAPPSPIALDEQPWAIFSVQEFAPPPSHAEPTSLHERQLRDTLARLHPIAGAAREVTVLRRHCPRGSQVYQAKRANEQELRDLPSSPAVLHLVTHGFFLPGDPSPRARLTDFDESPDRLTRSGLVLQGAGTGSSPERDDILFASEVATLPLARTRLVTLSSCDSGLGEELAGEGVLGLRRGFALAGAHNLLLSLWPVSDASTPDFMDRFYQLAVHTNHLGQAAWQTQKEALSAIDPHDEVALEEAVLRYGPFVLCQREALQSPAATIPPPPRQPLSPLWLGLLALAALALFTGIRLQRKRSS